MRGCAPCQDTYRMACRSLHLDRHVRALLAQPPHRTGSGSCSRSTMAAYVLGGVLTLCWVGLFAPACRSQIEGLQQQLQEEAEARNRMEEEMKRSFMRGEWCNLPAHDIVPSFDCLHRPDDAVGGLANTVCF